jgi:AcrR family transcriptional regulator
LTYILYVIDIENLSIKQYVAFMAASETYKGRREQYTEATHQALLSAGREAFAREGYQAAAIEAISRSARVTRGAFYHHFADKRALFDAVVTEMQAETAAKIAARAKTHKAIWDRLGAGIDAFLDVCLEPDYARIVIQEAPVVLGGERHREIEEAYPMALLAATLEALSRSGELDFDDIGFLCRMVDALACKVALMLPHSKDPAAVRQRGQEVIGRFLENYRRAN